MKKFIKTIAITLVALSLFLTSCGKSGEATNPGDTGKTDETKKFKVALLLPGTINDNGWNATAYNGLMLIEKELGAEVSYSEKIPQSDFEEIFRNYASQGYNLVIGHGDEFKDAGMRVAKEFPDVNFLITSTDKFQAPNLASENTNPAEMGFLEGVVAALTTKTNKVGAVGGMELISITAACDGFVAGAKYINPNIEATVTMTGDFDDALKAKEAAKALITEGADVVMLDADQAGLGVIEACKEKGVYAVSSISVQHELAPDTVLGSGISDVPLAMELVAKHVIDGTFEAKFYELGLADGAVYFVPNPKFESTYKDKLNEVIEDIKSGKINVAELIGK